MTRAFLYFVGIWAALLAGGLFLAAPAAPAAIASAGTGGIATATTIVTGSASAPFFAFLGTNFVACNLAIALAAVAMALETERTEKQVRLNKARGLTCGVCGRKRKGLFGKVKCGRTGGAVADGDSCVEYIDG
jgi:hypothetical protein